MNTFLPYDSFSRSVQCLDVKRLGKQRIETIQIINASLGRSQGWRNHPATKMWNGYESALATYGLYVCSEWRSRGYDPGTTEERMRKAWFHLHKHGRMTKMPPWLGNKEFHYNHREILVWKDPGHYLPLFEDIEDEIFIKPEAIWL